VARKADRRLTAPPITLHQAKPTNLAHSASPRILIGIELHVSGFNQRSARRRAHPVPVWMQACDRGHNTNLIYDRF